MRIPVIRGRRHTTLPDPPRHYVHGNELNGLANIMRTTFLAPIRAQLNAQNDFWHAALQPDPWDEAVKWIEQSEAAKAEWPWPSRP